MVTADRATDPGAVLNVVCAVIRRGRSVLAARRPPEKDLGGKWEFPGGKQVDGETPEAAIRREIREELGCGVEIVRRLEACEHRYPDLRIRLIPFVCEVVHGEPIALEHMEIAWANPEELRRFDWADADVAVLNSYLREG